MQQRALGLLQKALNNANAAFRDGQWECIESLLTRKKMLVVQRTGWGKSMVYFLATKLLRDNGAGPALLISPLLSLMRNQLDAAVRIGIAARTINSTNDEEWFPIQNELLQDEVDILLISPERLANEYFRQNILGQIAEKVGFFVIDEAHCISDWGHDFRPDYKRITRVLQVFPGNIPVLATTATANDRVVKDAASQLGENIKVVRGSLVRESLSLQNINMPSPAARMAWLASTIPRLEGSGIVYTLTTRDAEQLTNWLIANKINSRAYHAKLDKKEDTKYNREQLEWLLLNNEIKVLVATVALGMGFDKPDLGFVIHFQRPASVVHYYQQVGRAGRAVDEAHGVLLCGEEDDHIAEYFRRSAFPPQNHINSILKILDESDGGLSVPDLQKKLNLRKSQIEKTIKYLTVESPAPVTKIGTKWSATAAAGNYAIDQKSIDKITQIRENELVQMQEYMDHQGCLMEFLENALDDESPQPCGKCSNCNPEQMLDESVDEDLTNRAAIYLRRNYQPIKSRKRWPVKDMFAESDLSGYNIPAELQCSEGRALSIWRDAGWGHLVYTGKYKTERFDDQLIQACVEMIKSWNPTPNPGWITCVPSLNHPKLVPEFAKRLAKILNLPFISCVKKVKNNKQQKFMENNYQQAKNLDGVFSVDTNVLTSPCILVDDMVDSGWTFTVMGVLLRKAGCGEVFPLALALNSSRME